MTKSEFAKGWKLLILQPWGWRYRSLTTEGKPSIESQTQMEFYYDNLKWGVAEAWWKVAELYAKGKEWPSLNELRDSLLHLNRQCVQAIPGPKVQGEGMPAEVRDMLSKIGRKMP